MNLRARAVVLAIATALVVLAAVSTHTDVTPTASAAVPATPSCPDHPDVPLLGTFTHTRVVDGRHVDVYRIPNRFGFRLVSVYCD